MSRRIAPLNYDDLKKLGIVLKRAQFFITCNTKYFGSADIDDVQIRRKLIPQFAVEESLPYEQLSLFTVPSHTATNSAFSLDLIV
jgi:predicted DNA-binding helix-hairpin-helix protein